MKFGYTDLVLAFWVGVLTYIGVFERQWAYLLPAGVFLFIIFMFPGP